MPSWWRKKERCSDLSRQLRPLFGERVVIQCADALKWLPRTAERFDLVFVDPPYDLGLAEPACRALEALKLLMPEALIYVESRRQDGAPEVPENWRLLKEKAAVMCWPGCSSGSDDWDKGATRPLW